MKALSTVRVMLTVAARPSPVSLTRSCCYDSECKEPEKHQPPNKGRTTLGKKSYRPGGQEEHQPPTGIKTINPSL